MPLEALSKSEPASVASARDSPNALRAAQITGPRGGAVTKFGQFDCSTKIFPVHHTVHPGPTARMGCGGVFTLRATPVPIPNTEVKP